jgi:hypothetical protein
VGGGPHPTAPLFVSAIGAPEVSEAQTLSTTGIEDAVDELIPHQAVAAPGVTYLHCEVVRWSSSPAAGHDRRAHRPAYSTAPRSLISPPSSQTARLVPFPSGWALHGDRIAIWFEQSRCCGDGSDGWTAASQWRVRRTLNCR